MITAAWLSLIAGIVAIWIFAWQRQQQEIRDYRSEIKALRQTSGGLEQILARRGRRLDVLLSAVNEVVIRVDRLGRVMAANQRARELFAMDARPELPQSMLLFYREPDWHSAFSLALKDLPEAAKLPEISMAGRVLAPRLAPLGRDQALLLCVDMTDMYKLEAQRRTFLSNLMHDLKTPLTSLLGYARSLDQFGDDADFRKEAAQVIADEAKRVNHLLDALLSLDHIEFSNRDMHAMCQLPEVLGRVTAMLASRCAEKRIVLQCDEAAPEMLIAIAMLDDELERMLSNLLVNAINHAPVDSLIEVSWTMQGQSCCIAIEDVGPGIPEPELIRVTERFYRLDKARNRKDGGHGLGLAIVKELAEKNAGQLTLSNRPDGGLRAEIILPLTRLN